MKGRKGNDLRHSQPIVRCCTQTWQAVLCWLQFVVLHASRQRLYLKMKQKAAEEHGCSRREWKELPTQRPALPPLCVMPLTARADSEFPGSGKKSQRKVVEDIKP